MFCESSGISVKETVLLPSTQRREIIITTVAFGLYLSFPGPSFEIQTQIVANGLVVSTVWVVEVLIRGFHEVPSNTDGCQERSLTNPPSGGR